MTVLQHLGTELVWQVLGSVVAFLVAVAGALPSLRGGSVHPARLVAGAALAAALPLALTRALFVGWGTPGAEALRVTTFAAEFLLAPLTAGPALVVTASLLGFAAWRAPGDGPRDRWRAAPLVLGGVALAVALPVAGHATANPLYADLRAAVYLLGSVGLGAAAAGGRGPAGRDAATAAAATFPLVVALGEASERGLVWLVMSLMTSKVAPEWWSEAVVRMRAAVALEWTTSAAAVGIAAAAAGVATARRDAWARGVVPWLVASALAGAVLAGADLAPARLQILASLCTGPAPPGPPPGE